MNLYAQLRDLWCHYKKWHKILCRFFKSPIVEKWSCLGKKKLYIYFVCINTFIDILMHRKIPGNFSIPHYFSDCLWRRKWVGEGKRVANEHFSFMYFSKYLNTFIDSTYLYIIYIPCINHMHIYKDTHNMYIHMNFKNDHMQWWEAVNINEVTYFIAIKILFYRSSTDFYSALHTEGHCGWVWSEN